MSSGIAIGLTHLGDADSRDRDLGLLRSAGKLKGENLAQTTSSICTIERDLREAKPMLRAAS